jgi:hypothetical protein
MMSFRALWSGLLLVLPAVLATAAGTPLFEQMSAQYRKDFGIEMVAGGEIFPVSGAAGSAKIEAQNVGPRDVDMVLYFLRKEFGRYPAEAMRASGVKRIVFCHELKLGGQRLAGLAVSDNSTIYVESVSFGGDEAHRRRVLHHEFFHFLDYAIHAERDVADNPAWLAAGAPGATYLGPHAAPRESNWASNPAPGFVSSYARTSATEDRAEVFCGIMTNNLTMRLALQKDQHLAAKVRVLKDELKAFCPQIDEAFWERTAKNF